MNKTKHVKMRNLSSSSHEIFYILCSILIDNIIINDSITSVNDVNMTVEKFQEFFCTSSVRSGPSLTPRDNIVRPCFQSIRWLKSIRYRNCETVVPSCRKSFVKIRCSVYIMEREAKIRTCTESFLLVIFVLHIFLWAE